MEPFRLHAPRMARRGRASVRARLARLRPALWPIVQTAVAAGVAWWLATEALGHTRPIFASITAIVAMGFAAGRRGRQVVLIVAGTAIGIGLADVLLSVLDPGAFQVTLVVLAGMALGLLLSPEPLFVTQVGISAMLLVAVERDESLTPDRLEDALVGGAVAIVVSVVLFPIDPLRLVLGKASAVFGNLAEALDDTAVALRTADLDRAQRARTRGVDDADLRQAVELALDATRIAPLRRRDRPRVAVVAAAAAQVPAIARGVRVAAGSAHRVVREGHAPAPDLARPLEELAASVRALSRWLGGEGDEAKVEACERAAAAARLAGGHAPGVGLGESTLLHLTQAIAYRLLLACGLDEAEATRAGLLSETDVVPSA